MMKHTYMTTFYTVCGVAQSSEHVAAESCAIDFCRDKEQNLNSKMDSERADSEPFYYSSWLVWLSRTLYRAEKAERGKGLVAWPYQTCSTSQIQAAVN